MSEVICKECGSKENRWHLGKRSSIPDGRLTLHDCSVIFYLGCEDCSETLKIIHDDEYMEMFVNLESENAKLKQDLERHAERWQEFESKATELSLPAGVTTTTPTIPINRLKRIMQELKEAVCQQ